MIGIIACHCPHFYASWRQMLFYTIIWRRFKQERPQWYILITRFVVVFLNYHDNCIKNTHVAPGHWLHLTNFEESIKGTFKGGHCEVVQPGIHWEPFNILWSVYSLRILHHVIVSSVKKKGWNKARALVWRTGNEGLCSCFSGSVHCSDSGDKNVACVSLRALACLQNASVLWSRHRPAGGGGLKGGAWGRTEGGTNTGGNSRSLGFQPPG